MTAGDVTVDKSRATPCEVAQAETLAALGIMEGQDVAFTHADASAGRVEVDVFQSAGAQVSWPDKVRTMIKACGNDEATMAYGDRTHPWSIVGDVRVLDAPGGNALIYEAAPIPGGGGSRRGHHEGHLFAVSGDTAIIAVSDDAKAVSADEMLEVVSTMAGPSASAADEADPIKWFDSDGRGVEVHTSAAAYQLVVAVRAPVAAAATGAVTD